MTSKRWLPLPTVALIGMLALPSHAAAQTQLSPDAFLNRLDRAQALAQSAGETPSERRMADLRDVLGLPVEIVIGDWSTEITRDPILEGLTGTSAADFERASARLTALSRAVSAAATDKPRPRSAIGEALAGAYSGVVPPRPDPLAAALRFADEALQAILQRVRRAIDRAGTALGWFVLIAIVSVAAVGLLRTRLVPDRRSRAGLTGQVASGSIDWTAQAEAAIRAGDRQKAVRAFYAGLLAVLAARGIVADAPALTAGEARVAVRRVRPEFFPAISKATETYERVVYGGVIPDERDIQDLRDVTFRVRTR